MNQRWKIQFRRSWILCRTFGARFMDPSLPRPYGRGYFLSPLRGTTSEEPWVLISPHTLQITSPGAKRRQRVAPAVRPGNVVSVRTSAEGATPCIHTPTLESRLNKQMNQRVIMCVTVQYPCAICSPCTVQEPSLSHERKFHPEGAGFVHG